MNNEPRLSFVLATDSYATIRPVLERLRRQTIRDQIEVVLVAPSREAVGEALAHRGEFASLRIVENPVSELAVARAEGIRAAAAPAVFVGETHSYPHPEFAECLLKALAEPWTGVAPAFGNANPSGTLSWASFLADYGRWADGLPAGEIPEVPLYNALYRRTVLLELGDRLARALAYSDELPKWMRSRGYRTWFEPTARIDHVNVAVPADWAGERFVGGLLISSHRARDWPLAKRVVYVGGAALIPLVLFWRILPGVWRTVREKRLPVMTLPAILAGMIVKSAGELLGYAGVPIKKARRRMHEYEVHKLAYAAKRRA
jgi:hypothetical protein